MQIDPTTRWLANNGAYNVPRPKNNATAPPESEGSQIITRKRIGEKVRTTNPLVKNTCCEQKETINLYYVAMQLARTQARTAGSLRR